MPGFTRLKIVTGSKSKKGEAIGRIVPDTRLVVENTPNEESAKKSPFNT